MARYGLMRPRTGGSDIQPAAPVPNNPPRIAQPTDFRQAAVFSTEDAQAARRSNLTWSVVGIVAAILHWRAEIYAFLIGLLQFVGALAEACAQAVLLAVFLAFFLRLFLSWFLAWLQVALCIVGGFVFLILAMASGGSDPHRVPARPVSAPSKFDGGVRPAPYGREPQGGAPASQNAFRGG